MYEMTYEIFVRGSLKIQHCCKFGSVSSIYGYIYIYIYTKNVCNVRTTRVTILAYGKRTLNTIIGRA